MNVSSANTEYFSIAFLSCELPNIPDIAISAGIIRLGREAQACNERLAVGNISRSMNSAFFRIANAVSSWTVSWKNKTGAGRYPRRNIGLSVENEWVNIWIALPEDWQHEQA